MTEHIFREVHYGYTDGTALGRTLEKQEEIVRCRDCKHYEYCQFHRHSENKPNGFCAWGERRDA